MEYVLPGQLASGHTHLPNDPLGKAGLAKKMLGRLPDLGVSTTVGQDFVQSPQSQNFFKTTVPHINLMGTESAEVMVLGAIRNGNKSFSKIRKAANVDAEEMDKILESLEERGLIQVQEKKGWLGTKVEITTTGKGDRVVEERIREMEKNWGQMVTLYKSGNREKLSEVMEDRRSIIPMMLFFGIIDMMMFSMMFSMIGASMGDYVPADQMPADMDDVDPGADGGDTDGGGFDADVGF